MRKSCMSSVMLMVVMTAVASLSYADGRVVRVKSDFAFEQTSNRLAEVLASQGAQVISRSRQAEETKTLVGSDQQAELFLIKNPYIASYTGRCRWDDTHHKPLRSWVSTDERGDVWLAYEVPEDTINAFGIIECGKAKDQIRAFLHDQTTRAAGR